MRQAGEQPKGYPSDLTDAQWQVIAPHLPQDVPGRRGRPRIWPLRRIIEAILYLDRAGCAWRYLPSDYPPWGTVYGYFAAWRDDGTLARLHDALRAQVRAAAGRDAEPTAAVIDSQSVRAADTVPKATRGWDNAKKVNGRKRHIAVDSAGLLLAVVITAASVQDRDAARPLLWNLHRTSRRIRLVWADAVYAGKLTAWAAALKMRLQIVARRNPHTFEVLPRRWVVERTFAWISKHRRTVRDYERLPASHEAMILWAMTALMASRLTQPAHLSNTHLGPSAAEQRERPGRHPRLPPPARQGAQRHQRHIAQRRLLEGEAERGLRRRGAVHAGHDWARCLVDRPPPAADDHDAPGRVPGDLPGNRSEPQAGQLAVPAAAHHDHLGGAAALAQHPRGRPGDERGADPARSQHRLGVGQPAGQDLLTVLPGQIGKN